MAVGVGASVTQTPGARSLSGLKRFVLNYIQGISDPDLESQAKEGVNGGIDLINSRVWKWNYTSQSLTTSATDSYSLNASFHKPIALQRLNSSSQRTGRLRWLEPSVFFKEKDIATSTGTPLYYTVTSHQNDGNLVLEKTPDSSFISSYPTLKLWYVPRVAYLSSDSDTLDAPPEFGSLVGWYGRWEMASVRGQIALADRAERAYNIWWNRLVADDNDSMTDWDDS